MTTPLSAVALVCSLNPSPAESSSALLARQVLDELATQNVSGRTIRIVDHNVKPGVQLDMGDGDDWPAIRRRIIDADILVIATPTWMGQHSSVCQRVLERLDAELSEKDDDGRLLTYGKVAIAAVVGNEDGAHHISAILYQGLRRQRRSPRVATQTSQLPAGQLTLGTSSCAAAPAVIAA